MMARESQRCGVVVFVAVVAYCVCLDAFLWLHIQLLMRESEVIDPADGGGHRWWQLFSPVTVKVLVCDPVNHFIYTPLSDLFVQLTDYGNTLSWITADVISVARVLISLATVRSLALTIDTTSVLTPPPATSGGAASGGEWWRRRTVAVCVLVACCWMDALDGAVHRLLAAAVTTAGRATTGRAINATKAAAVPRANVSGHGYVMDGVCDAITVAAVLVACVWRWRCGQAPPTLPPSHHCRSLCLPLSRTCQRVIGCVSMSLRRCCRLGCTTPTSPHLTKTSSVAIEDVRYSPLCTSYEGDHIVPSASRAEVLCTVASFAVTMLLASAGWNRVMLQYQTVLEQDDASHTEEQLLLLKSGGTCGILWLWRYLNPLAILNYLLAAIYFNCCWVFMSRLRCIGPVIILALFGLSQLHLYRISQR